MSDLTPVQKVYAYDAMAAHVTILDGELTRLREASQRLLDAIREHGDPVGADGHVWNAYWALQYLLDGKNPDGSDRPG